MSTGSLFVGFSTEPEIWGQKNNRFKPDSDDHDWEREQAEPPELEADKDQILEELNLSDRLTVGELQAIRRTFARQNHPDTSLGDSKIREERMKIANVIIDQQIQLRSQG
ncbi:MAG: hypothetical protein GY947_20685 [Rhodobacteraceae bacterium]|nr:hypothetical protein [Paracoccaceae bacterium]